MIEAIIPICITITLCVILWHVGKYIRENCGLRTSKQTEARAIIGEKLNPTLCYIKSGESLPATNVTVEIMDDPMTNEVMVRVFGTFDRDDVYDLF